MIFSRKDARRMRDLLDVGIPLPLSVNQAVVRMEHAECRFRTHIDKIGGLVRYIEEEAISVNQNKLNMLVSELVEIQPYILDLVTDNDLCTDCINSIDIIMFSTNVEIEEDEARQDLVACRAEMSEHYDRLWKIVSAELS